MHVIPIPEDQTDLPSNSCNDMAMQGFRRTVYRLTQVRGLSFTGTNIKCIKGKGGYIGRGP